MFDMKLINMYENLLKLVLEYLSSTIDEVITRVVKAYNRVQVRFSQEESKSLHKFTSKNLKNIRLVDGCLAGDHL